MNPLSKDTAKVSVFIRVVRIIFGFFIALLPVLGFGIISVVIGFTVHHWIKFPLIVGICILSIYVAVQVFRTIQKIGWIALFAAEHHTPEFEDSEQKRSRTT